MNLCEDGHILCSTPEKRTQRDSKRMKTKLTSTGDCFFLFFNRYMVAEFYFVWQWYNYNYSTSTRQNLTGKIKNQHYASLTETLIVIID